MKKFVFTMESMLKIKISMEKQLKNKQSQVLSRLKSCFNEIQGLENKKIEAKESYFSKAGMSVKDMQVFRMHYKSLEDNRLLLKKNAEDIKKELAEVQKQLIDVTIEKKTLEKLKQKQYEKYMYEYNREQEKELDDILSCRMAADGSTKN